MSITTDNSTPQIVGSVENIDPKVLQFEDNVRDQVDLDKDFLASLREHGVIVPILAVRDAEGNTLVREGQCRTLGAREVGLATVPVYVLPADATDADTATVQRIVQQMVANDQRHGLTNSQRARAIQQMLDTGMSATKVAKKLSMAREAVSAAGAASKSAAAMSALDEGQLDFGQAEVLAEFEDDADAVERLLRAARYGGQQFEHTVSTLRTRRSLDALYAETEKPYAEAGFTILQDRPSWSDPSAVAMEYLRTADGAEVPEDCEKKPEHWAVVLTEDYAYVDAESGEPVDAADLDDATEYDEDAEPAEGLRHYSSVTEKTVLVPEWFCLNPDAAGFETIESVREAIIGGIIPPPIGDPIPAPTAVPTDGAGDPKVGAGAADGAADADAGAAASAPSPADAGSVSPDSPPPPPPSIPRWGLPASPEGNSGLPDCPPESPCSACAPPWASPLTSCVPVC